MKLIIYTDGASRGNPGEASYGFTVSDDKGKLIHGEGEYIGVATNNVAEYTGVLRALEWVKNNFGIGRMEVEVFADSKLVAEQLSGRYKIKHPKLKPLFDQIKILEIETGSVSYTHVPRSQNSQADRLANEALDFR